jgi:hypothetical protein
MDNAILSSHNVAIMDKDTVFRFRIPRKQLAALKRVAKAEHKPASEYVRELVWERVRREDAIRRLHAMIDAAPTGDLTDEEAMALADEAKHATRP